MIKSHYKLVFDISSEGVIEGKPLEYEIRNDLKVLDNLSLIEAPNDFGKSTLLHILALSCFGDRGHFRESIKDRGLLDKMDLLYNNPRTKLEFDIEITAHDKTFNAKKLLEHKNINRSIDGAPCSFENFKDNFDLIYQIPSDPIHRLKEVIKGVTKNVVDYSVIIEGHNGNLDDIMEIIDEDPTEKLKNKKEDLLNQKEKRDTATVRERILEKESKTLSKYVLCVEYQELVKEREKVDKRLQSIKHSKNVKTRATTKKNKLIGSLVTFNSNAETKREEYISLIEDLGMDIENLQSTIKTFKDINISDDFMEEDAGNGFWDALLDVNTLVETYSDKLVDEERAKQAKYLRQLKHFLDDFPKTIENESITTPIDVLLREIEKELGTISDADFGEIFKKINELFQEMDILTGDGIKIYKKLKKLPENERIDIDASQAGMQIEGLNSELGRVKRQISKVSQKLLASEIIEDIQNVEPIRQYYLSFIIEYPKYEKYNLKALSKEDYEQNQSLKILNEEKQSTELSISMIEKEIDQLKGQESDEFINEIDNLEKIETIFLDLSRKLVTLKDSLESSTNENNLGPLEQGFKNNLEKYLAKMIPEIPIEENGEISQQKIDRIDHIEKKFITEDGKEYPFLMFGSGRTSSLSYQAVLNNLSSDKMTIILFDEALMDDVSFKPLKEKMIDQYKNKNIFAGLFVRFSKDPVISPLID